MEVVLGSLGLFMLFASGVMQSELAPVVMVWGVFGAVTVLAALAAAVGGYMILRVEARRTASLTQPPDDGLTGSEGEA